MKSYQRLFGCGPRGALLSLIIWFIFYRIQPHLSLGSMLSNNLIRHFVVLLLSLLGVMLIVWSVKSLPVNERGRKLITAGAFRYVRHPLYAAFLVFINPAFALFLNDGIYLLWCLLLFPLWLLNVRAEERLMYGVFGDAYKQYCQSTGRFLPKIFNKYGAE